MRERRKPVLWRVVCEKMGVLKSDGQPDTGMAYKIAYREHEPEDRVVRVRLGLRDICVKCHRGFRKPAARRTSISPARAWWNGLSHTKQEQIIQSLYLLRDMKEVTRE